MRKLSKCPGSFICCKSSDIYFGSQSYLSAQPVWRSFLAAHILFQVYEGNAIWG
ncbi:hypothetical protein V6Z11_D01G076800 [Gossypium hirsutum]